MHTTEKETMEVLLLAAGYGTRLGELTRHTPKPLLEVGGRPMVEHIVQATLAAGPVDRILVVTNDRFAGHFERWARGFRRDSRYSRDSPPLVILNDQSTCNEDRRGANGDIRFAIEEGGITGDLLVVGGDNLFTFDLAPFLTFAAARRAATLLFDVGSLELTTRYSAVETAADGRIIHFEEKPQAPRTTFVSTCLYYYGAEHLGLFARYLEEGQDPDKSGSFLQWAHRVIPYYGFVARGEWWDIGDSDELQRVRAHFEGAP
jgi:glucose-1-phosphate thymidylyltransferase